MENEFIPDKGTILRILSEIEASPEFKESPRYAEILRYLVEETLEGRIPKGVTIAMSFFGKDVSFNSTEDASVRVFITNLRKKLEHYYLTTTIPFSHKLDIPAGHYKVEFIPQSLDNGKPKKKVNRRFIIPIAAIIILSFFVGYWAHHRETSTVSVTAPNPLWNDFADPSGKPTLIVLGDYFFIHERIAVGEYLRSTSINSLEEYRNKVSQDPKFGLRYEPNEFTFLRPSAAWGVFQILPILRTSTKSISLKLASQFTNDDLKSNNVIFIGSVRTLFGIKPFLRLFNVDYSLRPSSIQITDRGKDSLVVFTRSHQKGGTYEKDYSIVAKAVGPYGSTILMLLGFAESGAIEATHAACEPLLLKAIETKLSLPPLQSPFNFTLLIATEGMTQTIFQSDIRYLVINKPFENFTDSAKRDTVNVQ